MALKRQCQLQSSECSIRRRSSPGARAHAQARRTGSRAKSNAFVRRSLTATVAMGQRRADSLGEGFRDLTISHLPPMASTRHQLRTRRLPHLPADALPVPAEDPRQGRIVDAARRLAAACGSDEHRLRSSPAADADATWGRCAGGGRRRDGLRAYRSMSSARRQSAFVGKAISTDLEDTSQSTFRHRYR